MGAGQKWQTFLVLSLVNITWGLQPIAIKWLIEEWSAYTIVALRFLIISILLFAYVAKKEGRKMVPADGRMWFGVLLMGLTGIMLNNVLQFEGLRYTTVMNATLIGAGGPAMTALLAVFAVKERLGFAAWLGIIISSFGTLMAISHGDLGLIANINFNLGDIMWFLAQLAWSVYSLLGPWVMKRLSVLAVSAWAGLFGSLLTFAYGFAVGDIAFPALSPLAYGSFFYIVFLGGIFAMVGWNVGVKNVGASIASIFLNFIPVAGILGAMIFLGEGMDRAQMIGAAAIFAGVYLTTRTS